MVKSMGVNIAVKQLLANPKAGITAAKTNTAVTNHFIGVAVGKASKPPLIVRVIRTAQVVNPVARINRSEVTALVKTRVLKTKVPEMAVTSRHGKAVSGGMAQVIVQVTVRAKIDPSIRAPVISSLSHPGRQYWQIRHPSTD